MVMNNSLTRSAAVSYHLQRWSRNAGRIFVQHGQQVRRQEARRGRSGHDVGDAQREQGQQDDYRLLLKP